MIFVKTPAFTRRITTLLTEDEYAAVQLRLAEQPDVGDVIPEAVASASSASPSEGVVKAAALV